MCCTKNTYMGLPAWPPLMFPQLHTRWADEQRLVPRSVASQSTPLTTGSLPSRYCILPLAHWHHPGPLSPLLAEVWVASQDLCPTCSLGSYGVHLPSSPCCWLGCGRNHLCPPKDSSIRKTLHLVSSQDLYSFPKLPLLGENTHFKM